MVCHPLQNKVESKVCRLNYWTPLPIREILAWSVDLVNASTEENLSRNKYSSLGGGSGGLIDVHLKKL